MRKIFKPIWSYCRRGEDDTLVKTKPLLDIVGDSWKHFLTSDVSKTEIDSFRKHERTGRPLGEDSFIERMENLLDIPLKPQKPGPKKKDK